MGRQHTTREYHLFERSHFPFQSSLSCSLNNIFNELLHLFVVAIWSFANLKSLFKILVSSQIKHSHINQSLGLSWQSSQHVVPQVELLKQCQLAELCWKMIEPVVAQIEQPQAAH